MLRSLVLIGCLLYSLTTNALQVYIAFDAKSDPDNLSLLHKVEAYLQEHFPKATISVTDSPLTINPNISSNPHAASSQNDQIIVALGSQSLQQLSQSATSIPIIGLFISKASFFAQLASFEKPASYSDNRSITAIFSDPSMIKQLALIRTLYGDKTHVGYFAHDKDPFIDEIMDYAKQIGLSIEKLAYNNQTARAGLLKGVDVLLLQNNKALFNNIPLDDLLYIAYDLNNTGVIGYSSGLVKNGAVATTYYTLDDILNSLATSLDHFSNTGKLPTATYPETYQLLFNPYVIRSLGLGKPSDKVIIDAIDQYSQRGNDDG